MKRVLITGGFIFTLLALIFLTAPFLTKFLIIQKLKEHGASAPSIGSIQFTSDGLQINTLKLDPDGFTTIGFIGAHINWSHLHLERLLIKDAAATGEINSDGTLTIAGLTIPRNQNTSSFTSAQIPIQKLQLENMTLDLNTPIGALRFESKIDLTKDALGNAYVTAAIWSKQKQLGFTSDIKAKLSNTGALHTSLQLNDFRIEHNGFIASRMSGWLDADIPQNAPAKIGGEFAAGLIGSDTFKLQNFSARYDLQNNILRLDGKTALKDQGNLDFTITGQKQQDWKINIQNFDFIGEDFSFIDLMSDITFTSLSPLQTKGPQTLSIAEMKHHFHAAPIHARFAIDAGNFSLLSLNANLSGGSVTVDALHFADAIPQSTLHLKNINLGALLGEAKVNGLAFNGLVSGDIPFQIKDGDVIIYKQAHLQSVSGKLNYAPTPLPAFLQGDDERMQTVRAALENLDYDALDLTLEGPLFGDLKATLSAKGRNQAAFGERPVHLNLSIEGPLAPAITQMLNVFGGQPNMPAEGTE